MIDPYSVLELDSQATDQQVKAAYRTLAKKYHPDVSKDPQASEKFIEITEAYESIINGSTSFQNLYDSLNTEPAATYQTDPQERARQYARDKYEEFLRNNTEFKQQWYYFPAKVFSYVLIYSMYLFGVVIMVIPFGAGFLNSFEDGIVMPIILAGFGVIWLKTSKKFEKEIEVYFKEY